MDNHKFKEQKPTVCTCLVYAINGLIFTTTAGVYHLRKSCTHGLTPSNSIASTTSISTTPGVGTVVLYCAIVYVTTYELFLNYTYTVYVTITFPTSGTVITCK